MNFQSQYNFVQKSYGLKCKKTNSCKIIDFHTENLKNLKNWDWYVIYQDCDYRFSENHTDPDPDPHYHPNPSHNTPPPKQNIQHTVQACLSKLNEQ